MMNPPEFISWLGHAPYELDKAAKSAKLLHALRELTVWHTEKSQIYSRVMQTMRVRPDRLQCLEDLPFLSVRMFKEFELLSIPRDMVFKTLTSSGTSGQEVSRIYLDKETASLQVKALARLMADLLGNKRLPMLVVDSPKVLSDRAAFSARGAGILGFSIFGQDVTYALDETMQLDLGAIRDFLERHPEGPIFVFGFTFMIWQYLVHPMLTGKLRLPLERGIFLHGGGWKKLDAQSVDNRTFKQTLREVTGTDKVLNYYGLVEQTGSVHIECEHGHLHAPLYSEVIVRRLRDFSPAAIGEVGIMQVLSILPRSYPGHSLLTEDVGVIIGEDTCPCGRLGKYFHVHGRLAKAEPRGCSDTYEENA